jgi:two-component system CheB/CheR fusion protein
MMSETPDPLDSTDAADDPEGSGTEAGADRAWEALLSHLATSRGFDFHGYKRSSLQRRILKRMATIGVPGLAEYDDYLELHPEEFTSLVNTILINVTDFFRDPSAWEVLRGTAIANLANRKQPGEPIRVWSAGCATGEEAYTLAMVFAEALGLERFREQVKIYATDVDEEALAVARQATYTARLVEGVPQPLLERYFDRVDDRHRFRKDLRRLVIFGRHDLLQDAPIPRVDLIACRNTLMYFNAEAQARVLNRFQFALADGGYLVLGRAETMMMHSTTFAPVDLTRRIFAKVGRPSRRDRGVSGEGTPAPHARLRGAALEAGVAAQVVVDAEGFVVLGAPARPGRSTCTSCARQARTSACSAPA